MWPRVVGRLPGAAAIRSYARWVPKPAAKKPEVPSPSDVATNMILGRALNRTANSLVKCTVLDDKGRVNVSQREFKRSELLSKHGLLPRDLRKIDVSTHNIVPTILVRDNSILVNLLHIRALIKADIVLLFDMSASSDGKTQSLFLYDLEHRLRNSSTSGLPYELRALEAILVSVVTSLDSELKVHTHLVDSILNELERHIERDQLRHLLVQSKNLSAFLQKATLVRDTLSDLIDNDEDLAGLYLTAKKEGHPLNEKDDHSDAEIMLESYYNHCDEIVQTVENLESNIRSTEEIINIILDSNRNSLMTLELKFQIGMLGLSIGGITAALYGMNLKNFIEDTNWGFAAISAFVGLTSLAVVLSMLRRLRTIQRTPFNKLARRDPKANI